jgi:electron transport complex protein RnfA
MTKYILLFVGAAIVNNFVLTRFLGLCIFFGVSKKLDASIGMGMAVTSVMTLSSMLAWVVYTFVLAPLNLIFLKTVVFVLLIASFVQLLEMVIKKLAPALYGQWGIYLLLIATNCIVLSVPLLNAEAGFGMSVVNALGSGVGFAIALILMSSIREKLELADVPKPLQGLGIAFIVAGMLSLAFLGFSGMIPLE